MRSNKNIGKLNLIHKLESSVIRLTAHNKR
jgi:hypothetical protein